MAYSKNLKQNLENLFTELNRMGFITSKQMYNDALKLFHIETRQVQKGHLVFVTDGNGKPVRHPIKMSEFEERPRFYFSEQRTLGHHFGMYPDSNIKGQSSDVLKSLVLKELIRRVKTQFEDASGLSNKRYKLKSQKKKAKRKL